MKKFRRRSARMNIRHYHVTMRRYFRQILTSPAQLLPLIFEPIAMLIILLLVAEKDAFLAKNSASVTSANIILFVLVIMAAMMGLLNSYREICKEREVLAREVFGGLDITAYALSKSAVLCIVGAVQCAALFFGSLTFLDFAFARPAEGYILCLLALILVNVCVTNLGLLISAALKNSESAILPVLVVLILQVVFSDCLIEIDGAAGWIKYITPSAWGIAVFGRETGINGWSEWFHKDLYALHPAVPLVILAVFSFVLLSLTIWKLKRTYRRKD